MIFFLILFVFAARETLTIREGLWYQMSMVKTDISIVCIVLNFFHFTVEHNQVRLNISNIKANLFETKDGLTADSVNVTNSTTPLELYGTVAFSNFSVDFKGIHSRFWRNKAIALNSDIRDDDLVYPLGVAIDCTAAEDMSREKAEIVVADIFRGVNQVYLNTGLKFAIFEILYEPECSKINNTWNSECHHPKKRFDDADASVQKFKRNGLFMHWMVFTDCFYGEVLGRALISSAGSMKQASISKFVHDTNPFIVAHELGHTFGLKHVNDSRMIMNAYASRSDRFNPISSQKIISYVRKNVTLVKYSYVKDMISYSEKFPNCGNGKLDTGEECDAGTKCLRDSYCGCDCKLKNGYECHDNNHFEGNVIKNACCHRGIFKKSGTKCYSGSGVCNPSVFCTENVPYCPVKIYPDYAPCPGSEDPLDYCLYGKCKSRNIQCSIMYEGSQRCDDTRSKFSCRKTCSFKGHNFCVAFDQSFENGTTCGFGGKCINSRCHHDSFIIAEYFVKGTGWYSALSLSVFLLIFSAIHVIYSIMRIKR